MKKLFTFFAAMALVSMSFAQLNETPVTYVQNSGNAERSEWYGFTSNSSSAYIFNSEAEYLLRIPAGALTPGTSITKVMFQHLTNENFGETEPWGCETYTIKIYTGTSYVPTTYIGSDQQEHTYDSLNPGTVAYSMFYSPTETGQQIVTLGQAFTVPDADFCVAIYAPDKSAGGLCPEDPVCETQSYAYMDDATGWWHYQFGAIGSDQYYHKPWYLAVFNDDGQATTHKCDWKVALHDPNDSQTFPDEITSMTVDNYTDSLYLAFEMGNMGPDTAYGHVYFDCYVQCNGNTTMLIEDDDWDLSQTTNGYMAAGYGWWAVNYGGLFDFANDFSVLGLSFPFELCIHCDWVSTQSNDYDPVTDNNTYCITVDYDDGINEKTNDLMVYPNPACNEIHIDNMAGAQISIFNIAGQEVMSIENASASATINVANLTEGLYIVRVVNGNEVATSKVNIVR